jgi:hypothetical protein
MYTTSNRFDFFGAWESKQTTQKGMVEGGAAGGGKGNNKIGQLGRNTDVKPLLLLCKMQIAPDLQSDLNVRWAYTFLDIWVADLRHFPMRWRAMSEEVFIVRLRSRLLSASLPCFCLERYVYSLGRLWVPFWDQPQKWPYKRPKYPFFKANGPTTPTEVVAG